MCSPDIQLIPLQLMYACSRVRIPAGYTVELEVTSYWRTVRFSSQGIILSYENITKIPAQSVDTDVFLWLFSLSTATLTRDNVSCTFTFNPMTDEDGNPVTYESGSFVYDGAAYILTPYTPVGQTPVMQTADIRLDKGTGWVPIGNTGTIENWTTKQIGGVETE